MKTGMPNVAMRYPRRLTVVRNSNVATVFVLRQRLMSSLGDDAQKDVFHRREQRLEAVHLRACGDERQKKVSRLAARLCSNPPLAVGSLHGSGGLRDCRQWAVHPHPYLRTRMAASDVVHAAVHHEPSAMNERNAIAEHFRVAHLMGGEHGRPTGLAPFDQKILDETHVHRIESRRWLVHDAHV